MSVMPINRTTKKRVTHISRFWVAAVTSTLVLAGYGSAVLANPPVRVVNDVESLYQAVNSPANAGVVVKVLPRFDPSTQQPLPYLLSAHDPSGNQRPNEGRLEAQPGMDIVSSLVLELDANGVPTGNVAPGNQGAIISSDPSDPVGAVNPNGPGIIVVDGGTVQGLTVRGFGRPGIQLVNGGSVIGCRSEGNNMGVSVLLRGQSTNGNVKQNLLEGNLRYGVVVGSFRAGASAIDGLVTAFVTQNRSQDNLNGLGVLGAFGGSGNKTNVVSDGNVFANNISSGLFFFTSADSENAPGTPEANATDNNVTVTSIGDRLSNNGSANATMVAGLVFGGGIATDNHMTVRLLDTTFEQGALGPLNDVSAFGGVSIGPTVTNNQLDILIRGADSTSGAGIILVLNDFFAAVNNQVKLQGNVTSFRVVNDGLFPPPEEFFRP